MLTKHLKQQSDVSEFVSTPNLPESRVSMVAISNRAGEAIKKLRSMNIECLCVNPEPDLPLPINSHADIQMLHVENNFLFCHKEHLFKGESEKKFNFVEISQKCGKKYPQDVLLNCTIIGNKIICNPKTVAVEVLKYAHNHDFTIIPVNQGYARCSVCVINKNAIITDDESIFRAAGNFLNDVLLVSKNSIELKGYNYGFIGGCCGKIDIDKIGFNGEIESHKDYKLIIDFLNEHSIECVELKKGRLSDIGGIIPLLQHIKTD